jgi:MOSC domain-containing protein
VETELSRSPTAQVGGGAVVSLWRYPVKSMMGEELNASEVTERGLVGDRQFALRDHETGKVVGAKNPRKWGNFFDFRAAFVEPPQAGSAMPAVRITLPDGTVARSGEDDFELTLSRALGREVTFEQAQVRAGGATAEEYWPDLEGLDYRDTVTDFELPEGTFFDLAVVHLLTTATLDRLRALYPEGRLEVRRFRPNIVVATRPEEHGFVENDWVGRTVLLGDEVRLRVSGPCPRCVMTTLAQGDLPKDPGILRTAAQNNHANVGVYADVVKGGTVRRGDHVTVT